MFFNASVLLMIALTRQLSASADCQERHGWGWQSETPQFQREARLDSATKVEPQLEQNTPSAFETRPSVE